MRIDPVISAAEAAELACDPSRALVLLDCRPGVQAYAEGHIEGAHHADLDRDLSAAQAPHADPAQGGRHPLPNVRAFAETLGRWGVTPSSHVLAYDDQGGANAAARAWWMLRAVGHERVQVVDGGFAALRAAGLASTAEPASPRATGAYPAREFSLPVASIDDVERARVSADERVLDVRAAARFRGESEPIDPVAGHIPGARNLPLSENLDAQGRFKSAAQLRDLYRRLLNDLSPEHLIVHCGSGVTACHTLLALERAGLSGARLYVGSFSEWCRRPERPIGTGRGV